MANPQAGVRDDTANTPNDRAVPDHDVVGGEPMTAEQAFYLQALSLQAREPSAFNHRLTRAEASKQIARLEQKVGLGAPDE